MVVKVITLVLKFKKSKQIKKLRIQKKIKLKLTLLNSRIVKKKRDNNNNNHKFRNK